MVQVDAEYAASAAITKTFASLASDANLLIGRETNSIDNTTEEAIDYDVTIRIKLGSTLTANRYIEVRCARSEDGTIYAGGNTGSDAAKTHTAESKVQMDLIDMIPTNATNGSEYTIVFSLVEKLGCALPPRKCNFWIAHSSGANLDSTESNHKLTATPKHATSA